MRKAAKSWQTQPDFHRHGLLALALAGLALRLWGSGARDLWIDEAFSLWVARLPWSELVDTVATLDHHPPLYYALLRAWIGAAGTEELSLRLPSALLSVAVIPLFYRWVARINGPRSALIAAALLTFSPFHIAYAQEARMYALLSLCALGSFWFATVLLFPGTAPLRRQWRAIVGLAVSQALVMLSHNAAAVLFTLALNGAALCRLWALYRLWRVARPADAPAGRQARDYIWHHMWRSWLLGQAMAAALWIWWAPALVGQAQVVDARFWIPPPTWAAVWLAVQAFSFGHPPAWWLNGGAWRAGDLWIILFLGLAGLGLRHLEASSAGQAPRGRGGWLLLLWWVGPALALLISLRRPIFLPSTLIWTTFPYLLLVAAGIVFLWRKAASREMGAAIWARLANVARAGAAIGAIVLIVGAIAGGLLGYMHRGPREGWRAAAATVAHAAQPGDLVLLHASWVELPFRYYFEPLWQDVRENGASGKASELTLQGVPVHLFDAGELEPRMTAAAVPVLRRQLQGRERVWLVYSHAWYTDAEGLVPATLATDFSLHERVELKGVAVLLYVR